MQHDHILKRLILNRPMLSLRRGDFWPQEHNLNKLGSPTGDAKNQISNFLALSFQKRFFHVFPIKAYVKHVTTRAGPFWPQGHDLTKLGRGPLDDATYQILRL